MPRKLFVKLFPPLVGLVLVIALVSALVFSGLNRVRLQVWQEQVSGPFLHWLASVPNPQAHYHWLDSLYDFQSAPPDALALSPVTRERLAYGHVVAQETSVGTELMVVAGDQVLVIEFSNHYRDLSESIALTTLFHLNASQSIAEREQFMARLSEALRVPITTLSNSGQLPPDDVLERVADRGLAFYQPPGEGRGQVLLRLSDGSLIHLGMPSPFDPWAWPVLLLLGAFIAGVLAIGLLLLVRALDHNLRAVESVSTRIARGEMDARVDTSDRRTVPDLARAFNVMADHIQRLVDVQREMIHAVSHELRTPVARIRFGVQMVEDSEDPATLHKQLEGIDGDIQELDELIDEILTYARLEQGGPVFALQECSMADLVHQVKAEQQVVHANVEIDVEIPESSQHDSASDVEPRYMHRALQNLVGNAARHASKKVLVTCCCDEETCRLDVEDDGPGIPEKDWEKVFVAFSRLDDSRTRTSGGYGLGLSIVRRILFWHGGQAFISQSETLGGARFSLVWPRKQPNGNVV
ncbi:MAG: HAMP domain-containing protein [Oleiphilaceae bacterium]|nr:HAMP domain-containing protein [Oleiphilaceae bacterium]